MNLSEIKGRYDLAISLGAPCQTAEQLKRHGLRTFSGPFDWTVLESVPCLIKAIDSNFDQYFERANLVYKGKLDHTYSIFDTNYQCMSVHDFPHVEGDDEIKMFDSYPDFIEKMRRRIQRFYERISESNKTLFVRYHSSYEDALALEQCLSKLTNDKFVLVILNETHSRDLQEENWDIKNTYVANICQAPDVPWQGYSPHWDIILNGISLTKSEIDTQSVIFDPAL